MSLRVFAALAAILLSCAARSETTRPVWSNDKTTNILTFNDGFGHESQVGTYSPLTGLFSGTFSGGAFSGNVTIGGTLGVTGAVSGAGFTPLFASPPPIGSTAPGSGAFTTLGASGAVSGAGFVDRFASPGPIGNTSPSTAAFTTFSASAQATFADKVYVTVPGAPFPVDVALHGSDPNPLWSWCFIGDGASHPLSSVTSCGGVSTAGWTLGQWQAKLPCVDSLANEADWAAVQCSANAKYVAGTEMFYRFDLPGHLVQNKPVDVCGHVLVEGFTTAKGSYLKQLGAGQDAIQFCRNGRTAANGSLHLRNLRFDCATASGCGQMLTANFTPVASWLRLTSEHVYSSEAQAGAWAGGYLLDGATLSQITYTALANKATAPWVGSCIKANSSGLFEASDVLVDRVDCSQWQVGFDLNAVGGAAQVEGWRITNTNIYATTAIKFTTGGGSLNQLVMDNVQGVFYKSLFETNATSLAVRNFVLTNSYIGLGVATANTGAYTPAANGLIDWTHVQGGVATGNWFTGDGDQAIVFGLGPTAGIGFNTIHHNHFASAVAPSTSWIRYFTGAAGNSDHSNDYYAGTPVTFQTDANRIFNRSDGYTQFSTLGKCNVIPDNYMPGVTESLQECFATVTGTTGASGNLDVTYPWPIGGGARVATPVPIVKSATTGCPTIDLSNLTTAGFTATFTGCPSTAVSLGYTVKGQ